MSKMLDRIRAAQQRLETSGASSSGEKEEIFFNLSEGVHRVRLVGEWTTIHSHWIGNSQYTQVQLFPDSAFAGENKIKKIIACADFNPETELPTKEKTCVLCKLRKEANDMLYSQDSDLDKEQKEYLQKIAREATASERYFFLCIDRDSPEIAPGKKGLKIIEFPLPLMKLFFGLAKDDTDIVSDNDGVDLIIEKTKAKKGYSYTLKCAQEGRNIVTSPLTTEEMEYQRHDIKKIMGKLPDQMEIYKHLLPDFQELIEEPVESKSSVSKNDSGESHDNSSQTASKVSLPKKHQKVEDDEEALGAVPF